MLSDMEGVRSYLQSTPFMFIPVLEKPSSESQNAQGSSGAVVLRNQDTSLTALLDNAAGMLFPSIHRTV